MTSFTQIFPSKPFQFKYRQDCTMFGGFTNGKKLSALCELNHIDIAPHHDSHNTGFNVGHNPY